MSNHANTATIWLRRLLPYVTVVIASLLVVHGNFLVRLWVLAFFVCLGIVATIGAWRATRGENGSDGGPR